MECRDVREMADSFLGEELLTETNHEILRHLDTCPVCRADLAGRRALREGVRRAFHRAPDLGPSPEFIAQLRTTLQDTAHQDSARRGVRFDGWWALAATLLLAVALGLAYRGRDWITATGALARAAVGDHRYCALQFRLAEKPISLEEAAQRYGAAYRVLDRVPPDVMTAVGPAHVLERHACVYKGRRFAHIVFTYRGERVSLLVTTVDGSVTPALPGETLPHLTSPSRIDGMSVVSFRASRQMVFFAGDVAQNDLLKLAEAVGEPLYRGLAATESAGARRRSRTSAVEDLYALDLGIGSSPVSLQVFPAR
jgi:anti-sigma factor RsiW